MLVRSLSFAYVLVVLIAGCGGVDGGGDPSPRAACEDLSAGLCERFYSCYSPDELARAGLPSSEAACVTMFEQAQGCAAETIDNVCERGNETYHPAQADLCVSQVAGLSCGDVRDPGFTVDDTAPACGKVCGIDP